MGTSQSHNLKSSPNWSAAKRAMTSLANGTDNKPASNAKFFRKWKQDSVVSLFLYLDSVFKHKHKLIHNQAPV